jgi:hypothetical protein
VSKPVPTREAVLRSRKQTIAFCVLIGLPGLVVSIVTRHEIQVLGGFLFGCAITILISRVFYEVGVGEDRDRAEGKL